MKYLQTPDGTVYQTPCTIPEVRITIIIKDTDEEGNITGTHEETHTVQDLHVPANVSNDSISTMELTDITDEHTALLEQQALDAQTDRENERQQAINAFHTEALNICEYAGIEMPLSWDDGETKLEALADETLALKAGMKLLKLSRKLGSAGIAWQEILN